MENRRIEIYESFFFGAVLAVIGGYLDAYTYIARGQVFANAQTGNVVLLGLRAADGEFARAAMYLMPIIAFILGILLSESVRRHFDGGKLRWQQYIILLELVVVTIVGMLPRGVHFNINFDTVSNTMVSFVCSLQVQSFRRIRDITCATTMCTGNLRSAVECLDKYKTTREKKFIRDAGKFFGIVLFFVIGAVISTFLTRRYMERSSLFCSAGLLFTFFILFFGSGIKKNNRE